MLSPLRPPSPRLSKDTVKWAADRPWIWNPRTAVKAVAHLRKSVFRTDVENYMQFCAFNEMPLGPGALLAYASSQEAAGLDPVAIANRVEAMQSLTNENVKATLERRELRAMVSYLRKKKANLGGPSRKPLVDIATLASFLHEVPHSERDLNFQAVWYVLIACGARPEETHTLQYQLRPDGLKVKFNGRKNETASSAVYWFFSFEYSVSPPRHVMRALEDRETLPRIGTRKNCAACVNSWLAKFHRLSNTRPSSDHITSCCPRVRMDNVLRGLVDRGLLAVHVFEAMMGHTIEVSTSSYLR